MTNPTRWVGIDLHRRRSQVAIIDEHGELTLSKDLHRARDVRRTARRSRRHARRAGGDLRLGSGWQRCSRTGAMTCTSRAPVAHQGDRCRTRQQLTRSTPRRSRTCCAPGCCPRRTSPRRSCATCASCCATGSPDADADLDQEPRPRAPAPARASCPTTATCSALPAARFSPRCSCPRDPAGPTACCR